MPEQIITGCLNGFEYEVTQTFVCGSKVTGEKSKYVNTLVIKNGGVVVLDTFWEGKESEAYLKLKASEEVSWFIDNQDLFTFNPETCEHRIKSSWSRHNKEQKPQKNALRIETVNIQDRCSLKMPSYWNEAERDRAYIDIYNGFIFDFGYCDGKCPEV